MRYRIDRFVGVDQSTDEHQISGRYAPEARNIDTRDGNLSVARGFARHTDVPLAGGIMGLCAFYQRVNGALNVRLLATNEGGVYEWSGGAWVPRYIGAGGGNASAINYQYNGQDVLLLADGARPVLIWDGGDMMTPISGSPAVFSQLALHYERIWGSGVAAEPDSVYWSRAFDPHNWSGDAAQPDAGGGIVNIPTWNGGRVIGLRALFNDVLVFKHDDLYRIVGTYPGDYEVVRVHGVVGPIAPQSIVNAGDVCFFLSRDGLCAYNGVTAKPVSDQRARRFFERINAAASGGACAAVCGEKLYLSAPLDGATGNSHVLEYDLRNGGCMERDGIAARCFLNLDDQLLFAGADGLIYRYGEGGDYGGAPVRAWWRTPWIDIDRPGDEKYVEGVSMFASGTLKLTFETDRSRKTRVLRLGKTERPVRVRLGGHGRRFRLTIQNVEGSRFTIRGGLDIVLDDQ